VTASGTAEIVWFFVFSHYFSVMVQCGIFSWVSQLLSSL